MLLRNKKKNDPNAGKWIGVGGKFEENETPKQCAMREIFEETGIKEVELEYLGLIHFISNEWEDEDMYLFEGHMKNFPNEFVSNEGDLHWVAREEVMNLPTWEGDRVFLQDMIDGKRNINYTLCYEADVLVKVVKES